MNTKIEAAKAAHELAKAEREELCRQREAAWQELTEKTAHYWAHRAAADRAGLGMNPAILVVGERLWADREAAKAEWDRLRLLCIDAFDAEAAAVNAWTEAAQAKVDALDAL